MNWHNIIIQSSYANSNRERCIFLPGGGSSISCSDSQHIAGVNSVVKSSTQYRHGSSVRVQSEGIAATGDCARNFRIRDLIVRGGCIRICCLENTWKIIKN